MTHFTTFPATTDTVRRIERNANGGFDMFEAPEPGAPEAHVGWFRNRSDAGAWAVAQPE